MISELQDGNLDDREHRGDLKYLSFESEFFPGPVFLLHPEKAIEAQQIVSKLPPGTALVSCRVDEHDKEAVRYLEDAGFKHIETLITLERPIKPLPKRPTNVCPTRPADAPMLIEIASRSFRHDRFHKDSRISEQTADSLKAKWVANGLAGRADLALVSLDCAHAPCGFNLVMVKDHIAVIDLIAVAPDARGQGYAHHLIDAAIVDLACRASAIRVGTQDDNLVSLNLYAKHGFRPYKHHLTFHYVPDYSV